jgi:hypothetical protein
MPGRKVVLGAKLGTTLPPESLQGEAPIPNFRRSKLWEPSKTMLKWFGLVCAVLPVIGGFGVACSTIIKDLRPTKEIERIADENAATRAKLNELIDTHRQHLEACESFREATGSAWSTHPNGEVKLPGVDQGRKVISQSQTPPVSKVDIEVKPLPRGIDPL